MSAFAPRARVDAVKQRVSLVAVVQRAVKLTRAGREWKGLCPFHQERTPSFMVVPDKDFYHCFGCGAHGDAIRFVMEHEGIDFSATLDRLDQDAGLAAESVTLRESAKRAAPEWRIDGRRAAIAIWNSASPARGEPPERFLERRGIDPASNGLLDVARYHPRCPTHLWAANLGPVSAKSHCPALVAPMLRVSGGRGARALSLAGVHITFLGRDGRKKEFQPWRNRAGDMVTPPSRVMWGGAARAAVPVPASPVPPDVLRQAQHERGVMAEWLCALIDGDGPLVVAEGLETTQSLLARHPDARMGWSVLSLGNLQGAAAKDGPRDSLRLWNLHGAPEGGPFTLADPGRVILGVDADMKPTAPVWVQERRGEPAVKRALTQAERSEVCAGLASWHWRRAGAERVAVVRPPMGADFNDLDRRVA